MDYNIHLVGMPTIRGIVPAVLSSKQAVLQSGSLWAPKVSGRHRHHQQGSSSFAICPATRYLFIIVRQLSTDRYSEETYFEQSQLLVLQMEAGLARMEVRDLEGFGPMSRSAQF